MKPFFESLPKEVQTRLDGIVVGILPTRDPNAMTLKSPNGEPIVVMDIAIPMILSHFNSGDYSTINLNLSS